MTHSKYDDEPRTTTFLIVEELKKEQSFSQMLIVKTQPR